MNPIAKGPAQTILPASRGPGIDRPVRETLLRRWHGPFVAALHLGTIACVDAGARVDSCVSPCAGGEPSCRTLKTCFSDEDCPLGTSCQASGCRPKPNPDVSSQVLLRGLHADELVLARGEKTAGPTVLWRVSPAISLGMDGRCLVGMGNPLGSRRAVAHFDVGGPERRELTSATAWIFGPIARFDEIF